LPDDAQYRGTMKLFIDIRGMCNYMRMAVSTTIVDRILAEFSTQRPTHGTLKQRLDQWYACFCRSRELQSARCRCRRCRNARALHRSYHDSVLQCRELEPSFSRKPVKNRK